MEKKIMSELNTMEILILESPELFHDGINEDLLDAIKRIKNLLLDNKNEYKYFVSYYYVQNGCTGFGSCISRTDKKITSENYMEVVESIKEENKFDAVAPMNFILLEMGEII